MRKRGAISIARSPPTPANIEALIALARVDAIEGSNFFVTDPKAALAAAETKLTKAFSLVPDHARAHQCLGSVYIFTKRAAAGIAECEHALALDQTLAHAQSTIGLAKIFTGRANETESRVGEALRLSPLNTMAYTWMTFVGVAMNHLGNWDQAVAWFRRAIEANRNYANTYFVLAAALAQLGRTDEACSAVTAGLALNPTFAATRYWAAWAAMSGDPIFLRQLEPILEGLRKAGVPEQ